MEPKHKKGTDWEEEKNNPYTTQYQALNQSTTQVYRSKQPKHTRYRRVGCSSHTHSYTIKYCVCTGVLLSM